MVLMFRSAQRVRRPSQLRDMATRGAWALRNLEERVSLGQILRGAAAFLLVCALTPALFLSYIVVSACRIIWCKLLEWQFPGIEPDLSPSVRAATDTQRNQGVVTLLLHVRGRCDADLIRRKFQEEVIDRRDSRGQLQFPRLRKALTSRWGHYAWRPCTENEFQLDSHIVVGSQLFRGRAVTEANIQDYVSDIVSKCLPVELPPWQLVLFPLASPSSEPTFYAMLRLHHLLVKELATLRALLAGDWGWGPPIIPRPYALSYLLNSTLGALRTFWLQLKHERDPALNPKILSYPSLEVLFFTLFFLLVDATSTTFRGNEIFTYKLSSYWTEAIKFEAKRRQLTMQKSLSMLRVSLLPSRLLGCGWRVFKDVGSLALQIPLLIVRFTRSAPARSLVVQAGRELTFWTRITLDGPRHVLGEILRGTHTSLPPLVSLCGRRVVAWSEPTPVELVERIAEAAGSTPVEVLLAAASGALREHYRRQGCTTPTVPVQPLDATGVLLLPPHAPQNGVLDELRDISVRVGASRHQPALLLASAWLRNHLARVLPSLSVRLVLNCVTRRYAAIIMTSAPTLLRHGPTTLWGFTVDNALLWRPPQANISVSLSLVRVGDEVRLAVMADQQLWPHHAALPVSFVSHLRELAVALHVPRSPRHSPPPGASSSSQQHELLRKEEESLID